MGLDWVLERYRPRKGKEAAYKKAKARFDQLVAREAEASELLKARTALERVAHTPMEDLGAPRVGIDARATKWFLKTRYAEEVAQAKAGGLEPKPQAAALKEAHGLYVLELAKKKGGLAGGSFLVSGLDYGAGILRSCTDIIADASEAWVDHSAKEAATFAKRLKSELKKAKTPAALKAERLKRRLKTQGALGAAIASSGKVDPRPWIRAGRHGAMSHEDQRATVQGIVAWLEFWSKLGYGFKAWS